MITRYFNLFLNAGSASPLVISANQYDHGEQWVFTLYSQLGVKYEPSSGSIVGVKSDNLAVNYSGTVDSEGRVVINETTQMTAVAGRAIFELLIDGETHGTANFYVEVEPKPGDNADYSASDLSLIQEAINSIAIAGSGAPAVVTLASGMTDEGKVYLYAGSETGYTNGHWYYYNGSAWTDGGKYGGTVDATLTMSGVAADAKKVGDEINDLKSEITQSMPREVKLALDDLLSKIGVKNSEGASSSYGVFHAWATTVSLVSISAVFDQGENMVFSCDSLDSLKQYLTVTATYDDETTATITNYQLSGELTGGDSVITVSYLDKSTTITVDVTEGTDVTPALSSYLATSDTTLEVLSNGIRVSTTNGDYKAAYVKIPLRKNYTYRIKFDVETTNGFITVQLRTGYTTSSDKILINVKPSSESGTSFIKDVIPSDASNWNDSTSPSNSYIVFYIAGPTKITTTVTYSNIRIIEYMEA